MNDTALSQRRRWFRSFPEGTIEFLLATRILGLFLLLSLIILRESQRPMALMALAVVLLIDYVLMVWWAVQTVVDMEALLEGPGREPKAPPQEPLVGDGTRPCAGTPGPQALDLQRRKLKAAVPACLPAVVAFLALTPWPAFVLANASTCSAVMHVLLPAAGIAFVLLLIVGQRALQQIRLGPPLWTALLLIPFVHWFAMHRLLTHLRARLNQCRQAGAGTAPEGPSLALPIADVTWLLTVLPWLILVIVGMSHPSALTWRSFLPPCGLMLAAVFAVADVAALEGLQRQFVAALQRTGAPQP